MKVVNLREFSGASRSAAFHGKLRLQNNEFNACKAPALHAESFAEMIND